MIKYAVSRHFNFDDPDGNQRRYIDNYFDKLIQVPIRVPPLGTQEVRAYLMLLFVNASGLSEVEKERIRASVCMQLSNTWKGGRVDRAFMETLQIEFNADLIARFDTAERLAPLMTSALAIKGNPRLIKRFLNALAIRMSLSDAHGIGVDEAVLVKLLLFERCGEADAYSELIQLVNKDVDGKPRLLADWENAAARGDQFKLPEIWESPFVREWLNVHLHWLIKIYEELYM